MGNNRNYLRVIISNDSNANLKLKSFSTPDAWTGNWAPNQNPDPNNPGLAWQAEGDMLGVVVTGVPISGVEARVEYDIVDNKGKKLGEFYIYGHVRHQVDPGMDVFHIRTSDGYYASYNETLAEKHENHTILKISFRNTKYISVKDFKPSVNGFLFPNHWNNSLPVVTLGIIWNKLVEALPSPLEDILGIIPMNNNSIPITNSSSGLCGGMCYAAMDYYNSGQLPPSPTNFINNPNGTKTPIAPSSPSDPLFLFIIDRLLESFDFSGRGHRWLSYTSPLYPDGDETIAVKIGIMNGKAWVTYRQEWPSIRTQLDNGKLATIGLVQSDNFNIGDNHQVLAYAYEQSGQKVKLWIYDPNCPKDKNFQMGEGNFMTDNYYLEFDITSTSQMINVIRQNYPSANPPKRIYAILYMDNYTFKNPPNGRKIPPKDKPKTLHIIEASAETITTGGEVTKEDKNKCGRPERIGNWTCKTAITFLAETFGYLNPIFIWRIAGQMVTESKLITCTINSRMHKIEANLSLTGNSIHLVSASGDTFKLPISVELNDDLGQNKIAESFFEVEGSYSGKKLEDLADAARCYKELIPINPEWFKIPDKVIIDPKIRDNWKIEIFDKLNKDKILNDTTKASIVGLIEEQLINTRLIIDKPIQVKRRNLHDKNI